jgi:4-hydroxy-2-oxoheptanedioate aldolase
MIETARGVENVDEICSVPGVDAVYIGPGDLALSYGLAPTFSTQPGPHADAIEQIRKTCIAHGIAAGIQCGGGESARERADAGFTMLTVCTDAFLVTAGAKAELERAGGEVSGDGSGQYG